jgi:arabinose-5-phosphate isomerase
MQSTYSNPTTYFEQVQQILMLEAEAIARVAAQLDPVQVERAVKYMADCRGKIVLSGVGKSGIVARKIAATLTSVGVVAVFLHPVEALHGDLGIVTQDDVVLVLSNSGETDELVAMLPSLKQRNVPLVALVGNEESTLARNAHVVLSSSVEQEACPLNLAPTASTTAAIAVGDALAMTLVEIKGLTPEEFARNHPAGRLGKRLTVRVHDLMHSGENNPMIGPTASWLDVVMTISQGGLGGVNVVDPDGLLLGLITDGDLRRAIQKTPPEQLAALSAQHIMTVNPITVIPDELAYNALKVMENRPSQISVLPVVSPNQVSVGILRLHDIARCGLL